VTFAKDLILFANTELMYDIMNYLLKVYLKNIKLLRYAHLALYEEKNYTNILWDA
jgi:hypothetical protein